MSDTVRKLKDRASRLYSHGRLKDALAAYGQVLEQDPSELQCRLKIGDLHRRLGNTEAAVAAYWPVAQSYAADGLLLKAIAVCKLILGLDSDNADTQHLLMELHAKRRGPAQVGPPVTLRGMGISPPPGGMVVAPPDGGQFNMLEVETDGEPSGLELDEGASAVGSMGASTTMWSSGEEDAWTADIPETSGDEDLDITVMPPVESSAVPPAVDPNLATAIIVGRPVEEDDVDDEEPVEMTISAHQVAAAWPASTANNGQPIEATVAGAPVEAAMAGWPVAGATGDRFDDDDRLGEDLAEVQIPLFSELPRNAFVDLLVRMGMREVEPGDVIIREGDLGDAFYVVASGRVRVSRRAVDGREVSLAYLSDGAFFGEMAVLQHGVRTATVTVEQPGHIFEIRREVLDDVIENYPSVAKVLRNFYRQRLLSTTLATHPVFTPFNPEERRGLMEMFKSRQVKASEVLLEQGKKGTGLFILLYGQLEVIRIGADGQEVTLAHLVAGDMFGEMSLLTNAPTVARVVAVSDCFVLRLSKRKFDEVIMTHPQVLELVSEVSTARASINDALLGAQQSLTGGTVLV